MKMTVVYEVEVDTGALVGTWTGDKLISQSSAHYHHSDVQGFFKCLHIIQTGWTF